MTRSLDTLPLPFANRLVQGDVLRTAIRAFRRVTHSAFDLPRPDAVSQTFNVAPLDVDLVFAMARGEEAAAAGFYDRHSAMVFGLAVRMLGQSADAEEVTVEVFAQAWRDADKYDGSRGSVVGWLTTIARTRALDTIRAQKRRDRASESAVSLLDGPPAMSEGFPSADRQMESDDRSIAVRSALGALPDAQRVPIELAFFEGLTHPEVAERLREPLGTIKTRIRLGMLKMRDVLVRLNVEAVV